MPSLVWIRLVACAPLFYYLNYRWFPLNSTHENTVQRNSKLFTQGNPFGHVACNGGHFCTVFNVLKHDFEALRFREIWWWDLLLNRGPTEQCQDDKHLSYYQSNLIDVTRRNARRPFNLVPFTRVSWSCWQAMIVNNCTTTTVKINHGVDADSS